MNLSQLEKEKLFTFLGCGNINAPIWFLGMEPGACEMCLSLENNISVRIEHFGKTIDLAYAHHLLNEDNRRLSQVWIFAAKIVHLLLDVLDWDDREKAKKFAKTELFSTNGAALATELLPLPRPNSREWPEPYKELFDNSVQYLKEVLPKRVEFLRQEISRKKPQFIFAYGKSHHDDYRKLGDSSTKWSNFSFFSIGDSQATIFVLLPFLGNGAFSNNDVMVITSYLKKNFPERVAKFY